MVNIFKKIIRHTETFLLISWRIPFVSKIDCVRILVDTVDAWYTVSTPHLVLTDIIFEHAHMDKFPA